MGIEVGILKQNRYIRDFLKHNRIPYAEFDTAREMLVSDVPVLFCDEPMNLIAAVKADKFVLTNHSALMQSLKKKAVEKQGYYYVMKDFSFGERSFYANEMVYCCDSSMAGVPAILQKLVMEQEFFDVGETFSEEDQKVDGACILAGKNIMSLPWNLSRFDRYKGIALRPYYNRVRNHHSLRILPDVDHKGFKQLLLALLRYAYRRQEIWMPENHAVNIRLGAQDIEFIYPPEKLLGRTKRLKKLFSWVGNVWPAVLILLLLAGILCFTSVPFMGVVSALTAVTCIAVIICKRKAPDKMKYIIGSFAVLMIAANLIYNIRSLPGLLPLYHADTQTRYQSEFLEKGEYADALLQLLVKDRVVQVHDTGDAYEHPIYTYYEDGDPQMKFAVAHDPKYYYGRDYYRFFKEFAGEVSVSDDLVDRENFDFSIFRDPEVTTKIGYSNDMARYTFLINQDEIEQASYFWYDYVYREVSETMYIYMESEIPADTETLVALWDTGNNLYIMSRDFYEWGVQQ